MELNISVHPRLLSTITLKLSQEESEDVRVERTDEGMEVSFKSSDDDIERMAKAFEENAPAIRRYLLTIPGRG